MDERRGRAARANLAVLRFMGHPDVSLHTALDVCHRETCLSADDQSVALEGLDLRDDADDFELSALAGLDLDVLGLANEIDHAFVAVEEAEAGSLVDVLIVVEANGLVCIVLDEPSVTAALLDRCCRRLLCGGCLGLGCRSFLLLLRCLGRGCLCRSRCAASTSDCSSEGGLSAISSLACPATDNTLALFIEVSDSVLEF